MQKYIKFTKVTCNSSNLTCTNIKCRVKPISRDEGYFNLRCQLAKPMRDFNFAFTVSHQPRIGSISGKFLQLFSFKDLKACKVPEMCEKFPLIKPLVKFANESIYNGAIVDCPIGPGYYQIENATIKKFSLDLLSNTQTFPNGIYKIDIKLSNKKDDHILSYSLYMLNSWKKSTLDNFEKF